MFFKLLFTFLKNIFWGIVKILIDYPKFTLGLLILL